MVTYYRLEAARRIGRAAQPDEAVSPPSGRVPASAGADTLLGGGLEAAWRTLTGAGPAGRGTAEPGNLPWAPRRFTDLARGRMPEPTLVTAARRPPPALTPVQPGPRHRPGLHHPLGGGTDPAGWDSLATLPARLRTAVPPLP